MLKVFKPHARLLGYNTVEIKDIVAPRLLFFGQVYTPQTYLLGKDLLCPVLFGEFTVGRVVLQLSGFLTSKFNTLCMEGRHTVFGDTQPHMAHLVNRGVLGEPLRVKEHMARLGVIKALLSPQNLFLSIRISRLIKRLVEVIQMNLEPREVLPRLLHTSGHLNCRLIMALRLHGIVQLCGK